MTTPGRPAEPDGRRQVVILAGPSGAGKSRLAARLNHRHGWPIVRLDDFYRDGDDPGLPTLPIGIPDWDNPASWHADAAVRALICLCETGVLEVPTYDIGRSRSVGQAVVTAEPGQLVLAEGIFAAEIIAELRRRGVLAAAYCVRNRPWLTFVRRLVRDLAERRKSPWVLWRRGLSLARQEPRIVARHVALGAAAHTAREVESEVAVLVASR